MLYELTKTAHLVALFVWIGGMVTVALALRYPADVLFLKPLKSYDRAVTTPAMIAALLFGILLGIQGGWFSSAWLWMKIILVLVLSGLHGALVGKLRKAIWERPREMKPGGAIFLPVGFVVLMLILLLVPFKP